MNLFDPSLSSISFRLFRVKAWYNYMRRQLSLECSMHIILFFALLYNDSEVRNPQPPVTEHPEEAFEFCNSLTSVDTFLATIDVILIVQI